MALHEMKELKVGDKIIIHYTNKLGLTTVERLTKTTAILAGGTKLRIPFFDFSSAIGASGWSRHYYSLANDELMAQYRHHVLVQHIQSVNWNNCSDQQLKQVHEIIKDVMP